MRCTQFPYLQMKRERDVDKSQDTGNRINLEDAVDIVGTCDMMCPEFESLQRYFERDLDQFEKVRRAPLITIASLLQSFSLQLARMTAASWSKPSLERQLETIYLLQKISGPLRSFEYAPICRTLSSSGFERIAGNGRLPA